VRAGLALPQYDFSVPGENPLRWSTLLAHARRAEELGFHSLWLSDHLFFDVEKYGGGPDRYGTFEPLTTLAALARAVSRPRLGTLVLCEALRPATLLAKALAGLDRYCGGRLDVGIGAGWYEPDYETLGMDLPPPGERLARLAEALDVLAGLLPGGPFTYEGRFHRAREAPNRPAALQSPRPPVFLGGKGDRLLRLVAERADGWNTCWAWTPEAYRERLAVLEEACAAVGRQPATVWRSLGLYALAGWDDADLELRFQRLRRLAPGGMLDGVSLEEWREGRLAGTVEEVAQQVAVWEGLGVETLIVSAGPLPFSVFSPDDLDPLAAGLALAGSRGPQGG
jgi:alkanesulfonate monooxygenase SsuD/methylene tetrahydromethanopterin reductase-like flavin-dependent oxidoreductase (luciferase family)